MGAAVGAAGMLAKLSAPAWRTTAEPSPAVSSSSVTLKRSVSNSAYVSPSAVISALGRSPLCAPWLAPVRGSNGRPPNRTAPGGTGRRRVAHARRVDVEAVERAEVRSRGRDDLDLDTVGVLPGSLEHHLTDPVSGRVHERGAGHRLPGGGGRRADRDEHDPGQCRGQPRQRPRAARSRSSWLISHLGARTRAGRGGSSELASVGATIRHDRYGIVLVGSRPLSPGACAPIWAGSAGEKFLVGVGVGLVQEVRGHEGDSDQ